MRYIEAFTFRIIVTIGWHSSNSLNRYWDHCYLTEFHAVILALPDAKSFRRSLISKSKKLFVELTLLKWYLVYFQHQFSSSWRQNCLANVKQQITLSASIWRFKMLMATSRTSNTWQKSAATITSIAAAKSSSILCWKKD